MSRPQITPVEFNAHGDETHPSFGVVRVNRTTCRPPRRLFDSSIGHDQYVSMEIARATRRRDLHRDWIYGEPTPLLSLSMSLTQWGAMVSSFGQGSGTPITLNWVAGKQMPEADHESRLAVTAREVQAQSRKASDDVRLAADAVEAAFEERAGRRDMAKVISSPTAVVRNLPANMKYAADSLTGHAEDVVSKAKADIEASRQFGNLPALHVGERPLEIEGPS